MALTPLVGNEVLYVIGVQPNGQLSPRTEEATTAGIAALSIQQRGTFVATGTTPVTVAYAGLTRTMVVTFSLNTVGGTVGAAPTMQTITPGTGFTVAATAGDTSTYNWVAE